MRDTPTIVPQWGRMRRQTHEQQKRAYFLQFIPILCLCVCFLCCRVVSAWVISQSGSILLYPACAFSIACGRETRHRPAAPLLFGNSAWGRQQPNDNSKLRSTTSSTSSEVGTQTQRVSTSKGKEEEGDSNEQDQLFYIRPALMVDMGRASRILSDGFFKHKTNFFTYHWELLNTYLSLESTFPKPNTYHEIFVACCAQTGTVWGMVEVDGRPNSNRTKTASASATLETNTTARDDDGPYMCNLAVDDQRQRLGIATALVAECERQVQEWHDATMQQQEQQQDPQPDDGQGSQPLILHVRVDDDGMAVGDVTISSRKRVLNSLCLKVRASNEPAIQLYSKLGYRRASEEMEEKTGETVLLLRKELPSSVG